MNLKVRKSSDFRTGLKSFKPPCQLLRSNKERHIDLVHKHEKVKAAITPLYKYKCK